MKEWLTIKDAAEYLGVSRDFIRDMMTEEGLPYYKVRHTVFLSKKDIDDLIRKNRVC